MSTNNLIQYQLPIHYYFDNTIYQNEMNNLFNFQSLKYIGHNSMVPNIGDYYSLEQDNHSRMLIHNKDGVSLMSNICKHRQALILKGQGHTQNIVCPLHLWTYNTSGDLISAPNFTPKPCVHLDKFPLYNSQGMLFDASNNNNNILNELNSAMQLSNNAYQCNYGDYIFHSRHVHECNYNWKTFIEVYLEDYHVNAFHPGLSSCVNCDELEWQFSENTSLQYVGKKNKSGSKIYQAWQAQLQKYILNNNMAYSSNLSNYGAIWLTYYPNIMIEWYPFTMVVSIIQPLAYNKTRNIIDFYYPEDIALFEPELIACQQAAYMETCLEDDEIAMRMDAGRYGLYKRNCNEVGPYQHPMEDGMQHFHMWYQKYMQNFVTL